MDENLIFFPRHFSESLLRCKITYILHHHLLTIYLDENFISFLVIFQNHFFVEKKPYYFIWYMNFIYMDQNFELFFLVILQNHFGVAEHHAQQPRIASVAFAVLCQLRHQPYHLQLHERWVLLLL